MEINIWEIFKSMLSVMWNFRLVWLTLLGIVVIKIMAEIVLPKEFKKLKSVFRFNKGAKWRKDRDRLIWLRGLTPNEFEDYIAELFNRLGYKAYSVGGPNDGGIDVIAEKDGVKHYIQCKKYFKTREVSVGEVRDFYGALADKLANGKGYFITTSKFTLPAEQFADDKPIELVDGSRLLEYIRLGEPKNIEKEEEIDKCSKCGGVLIKRSGKYGDFMGCSNYPKCKHTEKIN